MDRTYWYEIGNFLPGEKVISQQSGVRLYDGEDKTTFENGSVQLTTLRLTWDDEDQEGRVIALDLSMVIRIESISGTITKSPKIAVYLQKASPSKPEGPSVLEKASFIRLSFRRGGQQEFLRLFKQQLAAKEWEKNLPPSPKGAQGVSKMRTGIVGIERIIEKKQRETDKEVSQAFKDLDGLIEKAKDMVSLVNKFAAKIEEKKGTVTEDETVQFKAYLLSVGIANPVTKESHGSGSVYHKELSKQLAAFLEKPLQEDNGIMTLADVYCRLNRARGMELVSPDDVVSACKLFETLSLPIRLRQFDSGVLVVQSLSHSEEAIVQATAKLVNDHNSLTAEGLTKLVNVSVMLANESTNYDELEKHEDLESESETEDRIDHESLLSTMVKIHESMQHPFQQRSEVSQSVSEFSFVGDKGKVSLCDLVGGVTTSPSALKKIHSVYEKKKTLKIQIPSISCKEIQRSVAYRKTALKVEKWEPVVKHNREATHLKFPIQEENASLPSLANNVETFVLKQRRTELMKNRAMMSYHEMKCRRIKKIKSKKFHRIQRKRQSTDINEASLEVVEKANRLRAKERMTLKHTNMAKWAKKQLSKGFKDSTMQQALSEHHHRKDEIIRSCKSDGDVNVCSDITQGNADNPWIETQDKPMISTSDMYISGSNYMQVDFSNKKDTGMEFLAEIHEAFAGDDVTHQFNEDLCTRTITKKEVSKMILPGWGSWGGEDLKTKKQSFAHHQTLPLKKENKSEYGVVVNDHCDRKLVKHLISDAPWPYSNLQQLEKSISTPLGRQWNTEATFNKLIKPEVVKTSGATIKPLKLTDDIESFMTGRPKYRDMK